MRNSTRFVTSVALAFCIVFAVSKVAAATVLPLSHSQMVALSTRIVVADVVSSKPRITSTDSRTLSPVVTDVRLKVRRVLKGPVAENLTLTQAGGRVGSAEVVAADAPRLRAGQSAILFLDKNGVVGGEQGCLQIRSGYVSTWGMSRSRCVSEINRLMGHKNLSIASVFSAIDVGGVVGKIGIASDPPKISSASPAQANAGIGQRVTLVGGNFGPAAGKVEFARGDSISWSGVSASIVEWSASRVVCEVPRGAQSGFVYLTTSGGSRSAAFWYNVGFSYSGQRWTHDVVYKINENATEMTGEGAAVRRAMDTWSATGADFAMTYGGKSTLNVYRAARDGVNDICWVSGMPAGYLATNNRFYYNGVCLESNLYFNADLTWGTGASTSYWDVETVALHELGHTVGLDDQYAETKTAMGAAMKGEPRRTLSSTEIAGAQYIYPNAGPTRPQIASSTHPDSAKWYASRTVRVSFSATDIHGISGYSYAVDESSATIPAENEVTSVGAASVTVPSDGRWWIHVRAHDARGDWSETSHFAVQVDGTMPLTRALAADTYEGAATIALGAADEVSGVSSTAWTLDGASGSGTSISTSVIGDHLLRYRSTDAAGNVEEWREARFTVLPLLPPVWGPARTYTPNAEQVRLTVASAGFEPTSALEATMSAGESGLVSATRGEGAIAASWHTLGATWWLRVESGQGIPQTISLPLHPMLPASRRAGVVVLEWRDGWKTAPTVVDTQTARATAEVEGTGPFVLAEGDSVTGRTTIKVSSESRLKPAYGAHARLVLRLSDVAGEALYGRSLKVVSSKGTVTPLVYGIDGRYYGTLPLVSVRTGFSAVFAGDGANEATATSFYVMPLAKVTAYAPSSAYAGHSFKATAKMLPSASRVTLKMQVQQRVSGTYKTRITKTCAGPASGIAVRLTLGRGNWRVRFTHSDADHSYSASSWRTVIVR